MLEAIKDIINRKMNFLESADIILEDFENNEIMDSLTDDELADSGDIGSSKDDLKLDDDSDTNSDTNVDMDQVGEVSSEDENEAIMSVTMDTRTNKITDLDLDIDSMGEDTNPMDAFLDEHVCENRMDYYFFPDSESKALLESSNNYKLSKLDYYYFASENFNPYFTEAIGEDSGDTGDTGADAPPPSPEEAGTSEAPAEGAEKETEVTTAVKEELADDKTGMSDDTADMDNFGDDSSSAGMDDMGSGDEGSDKTQKGKELLKQAKKLEDNIIEYFF